jgi:hypothetical protein
MERGSWRRMWLLLCIFVVSSVVSARSSVEDRTVSGIIVNEQAGVVVGATVSAESIRAHHTATTDTAVLVQSAVRLSCWRCAFGADTKPDPTRLFAIAMQLDLALLWWHKFIKRSLPDVGPRVPLEFRR